MARDLIRKYLPSQEWLRRQSSLGPVRHRLLEPELWHLHRRSVGGACFIGLFCAFMPIPGQMLLAASLAIAARVNLPLSVTLVWVSNPLTFAPMYFFAYKLGAWLLDVQVQQVPWEFSWHWVSETLSAIWLPLLVGCVTCGWVAGLTGTVVSRTLWRLHVIRRWRARRDRRRRDG